MRPASISHHAHALDSWLARGAIGLTAVLNAFLINNLSFVPWWLASACEIALLIPLSIATAWTQVRMRHAVTDQHWDVIRRHSRVIHRLAIFLTGLVTAINFGALYAVMGGLLHVTNGPTGQSLLIDALNIWFTNVVIFALWFWSLDRGGPAIREHGTKGDADFLFPQMATNYSSHDTWTPGFIDYLFVSFTNATAFSPTDTMPLSPRSKVLMMIESSISLLTVGLVAARAVNILA